MIGPAQAIDLRAHPALGSAYRAGAVRRTDAGSGAEARGRPCGPGVSPGPTRRSRSLRSACLPLLPQAFVMTHHDSHPLPSGVACTCMLVVPDARMVRVGQLT